jgi:hypothetical protein
MTITAIDPRTTFADGLRRHPLPAGPGPGVAVRRSARHHAAELRNFADPFADAVPVPEDAPLIDRLVAWNGRWPC